MKILGLADLHGEVESLRRILDSAGLYDAVVFVGDVTDFGPASVAKQILNLFPRNRGCFVLPGNCDPKGVRDVIEASGLSLHSKRRKVEGISFFGVGGSNKTPHKTPFEFEEVVLERLIDGVAFAGGVMATHAPPINCACDEKDGKHIGSVAVRNCIKKYSPVISICGHIHEGRGVDKIGDSVVVNPGAARMGYYSLIDLEGVEVELKWAGAGL